MTNRHKPLSIAIIGAGIGGLATAALLARRGMTVRVYEQAPAFARVGAGIQMAPNAVKVLRALGVEDFLRRTAFRSDRALSRVWDSGEKWALFERDPLPRWGECRVVLLGDACHPMTPYMAQGAASALEDAMVLSRCLEGVDADGVAGAFKRYEATRKPRTSQIQTQSSKNTWLKGETDPAWVYGYDACTAPLASELCNEEKVHV